MNFKAKVFLFMLSVLGSVSADAVPLVIYSFNGSTGSEASLGPDAQPGEATASAVARGSGITANAGAGTFSSSAWTTGSSLDANDYYTFSLTPDAGFSMTLTQIILDERRSGTGIRNWAVRSSLDSFGSDILAFSVPDNDLTRTGQTINLTGAFTGLSTALEFRIYGYAAEQAGGTWRLDNVKIEGSTQSLASVPDSLPFSFSAYFLLGFLALSHQQRVSLSVLSRVKSRHGKFR